MDPRFATPSSPRSPTSPLAPATPQSPASLRSPQAWRSAASCELTTSPELPSYIRSLHTPRSPSTSSLIELTPSLPRPGPPQHFVEGPDTVHNAAAAYLFNPAVVNRAFIRGYQSSSIRATLGSASIMSSSSSDTAMPDSSYNAATGKASDAAPGSSIIKDAKGYSLAPSIPLDSLAATSKALCVPIVQGLIGSKEVSVYDEGSYSSSIAERMAVGTANNDKEDIKPPFHPLEVAEIHFNLASGQEASKHNIIRQLPAKIERSRLFLMSVPNDEDEIMKFLATRDGAQALNDLLRLCRQDYDDDIMELHAKRPENMFIRAISETTLERYANVINLPRRQLLYSLVPHSLKPRSMRWEAHGIAIYTEIGPEQFKIRLVQTWNDFLFQNPIEHHVLKYNHRMASRYLLRPSISPLEKPTKTTVPFTDINLATTDQVTHILTTPLKRDLSYCLIYFEKSLRAGAQLIAFPELTGMTSSAEEVASSYSDVKAMFNKVVDFNFDFFFRDGDVWNLPEHKAAGGQYSTMQQRMDCLTQWTSQLPELVKFPSGREKKVTVVLVGSPAILMAWAPQHHWDTYELLREGEGELREELRVVEGEGMDLD